MQNNKIEKYLNALNIFFKYFKIRIIIYQLFKFKYNNLNIFS